MRRLLAIICLLPVVAAGLVVPTAVLADQGVTDSGSTTYELKPQQHVVHVTVDITVRNQIPSVTTYEPCTKYEYDYYFGIYPVASTCPHTTNYYINQTLLFVEDGAKHLSVTADSGSASRSELNDQNGFKKYQLTFKKIFNGRTRRIHATYDLPSAAPRSSGVVRVGMAYASFCVSGNGLDRGTIRVIAPSGFELRHWESGDVTFSESKSGARTTYSTGSLAKPIAAWGCFSGTNASGYATRSVIGPDGQSVKIESWPEDAEWQGAVAAAVTTSLPALVDLVGRPIPGTGAITIREVAAVTLGDYAGEFNSTTGLAVVGENYDQDGLVAHELSHAWFNGALFKPVWLSEGYADWAASLNGGPRCERLPAYPDTGTPDLEKWQILGPKATDAEKKVVEYDYDASCWLVASVADRIGSDRMTAVLASLMDHKNSYGATSVPATAKATTWQAWLDAVDELGMVPVGEGDLDMVQDRLAEVGVASDATVLAARSEARAAYHALLASAAAWDAPEAVRAPMASWNFSAADRAIAAAAAAFSSAQEASDLLPESNALAGPIRASWEGARTQTDLDTVAKAASAQARAAQAVAEAKVVLAQPRGPITQIGMFGIDTAPLLASALAAAQAGDEDLARSSSASIAATIGDAEGTGWLRVGGAGAATLALLAFVTFMAVRRKRRSLGLALQVGPGPSRPANLNAAPTAQTDPLPPAASDSVDPDLP